MPPLMPVLGVARRAQRRARTVERSQARLFAGALGASVTRGVGAGAAGAFSTAAEFPVLARAECFWALEWSRL